MWNGVSVTIGKWWKKNKDIPSLLMIVAAGVCWVAALYIIAVNDPMLRESKFSTFKEPSEEVVEAGRVEGACLERAFRAKQGHTAILALGDGSKRLGGARLVAYREKVTMVASDKAEEIRFAEQIARLRLSNLPKEATLHCTCCTNCSSR